jgi:hypothetical protein
MNFRSSFFAAMACSLAVAAIATGCGSGSDTVALTKSEFVRRGDAICKKVDAKRQAGYEEYLRAHGGKQVSTFGKSAQVELIESIALPPIQTEVDELEALDVPDGTAGDEATRIIEDLEKAIREVKSAPTSVLDPQSNPFNDVGKFAREYGFDICGQYGSI